MQSFTIKQIEQMSGIKAPTLRVWERRYKLIEPNRSAGKQRIYSNEDLRSILKVVYLYRKGVRISTIAKLNEEQVMERLSDFREKTDNFSAVQPLLLEAAIALDRERTEMIFEATEREQGFELTMLRLVYPFLENIGRAWVTGKLLPSNEHFVSQIIIHKILLATNRLTPGEPNGKVVILFQPQGEFHEIPLMFMNYMFKKYGWQTVYFGANESPETIEEYCLEKRVTHIYYHLVTLLTGKTAEEFLCNISRRFAAQTIVAGGRFANIEKAAGNNILLLQNDEDVYRLLGS